MNSGPCLDCIRKHLCQAMIIHEEEVPLGYSEDMKRVIGHLAEAARHAVGKHLELAKLLREYRKLMESDYLNAIPPYVRLIDFVEVLMSCDKQLLPFPDLPIDLKPAFDPTPK